MITEKKINLRLYGRPDYKYFQPIIPARWLAALDLKEGDQVEIKVTKMGTKPVISIGKV